MMWAVDPPRWFHFLRASSGSQIEKLWGYYKVRGRITLNMMTIPSWHFHFLKRLIPCGSWGQRCLLIFVQISSSPFRWQCILQKNAAWICSAHNRKCRSKKNVQSDISCRIVQNSLCKVTQMCVFAHFLIPFISPFKFLQSCSRAGNQWEKLMYLMAHGFVSRWWDKHGEEIKTPGFLPQSPSFILLSPLAMVMQGRHSRV